MTDDRRRRTETLLMLSSVISVVCPLIKQNPRHGAGGYGKNSLAGRPAFPPRQDTLRFSADVLPRLVTSSYSTVCPSFSVLRPARSTAEIWTNTSFSPVDGRMNP